MSIYLDDFVTELCREFKYDNVMVDLIVNTCYYGTDFEMYNVHGPKPDFNRIYLNLQDVSAQFFMNSCFGVYENVLHFLRFILAFVKVPAEESNNILPWKDTPVMTELLKGYQNLFGNDPFLEADLGGEYNEKVVDKIFLLTKIYKIKNQCMELEQQQKVILF